jgi:hypothetical protein
MKKTNIFGKWLLLAPLLTTMTGCLNNAKESNAGKSFKINDSIVRSLMDRAHQETANSLTVFFIPDSAELGMDITTASSAMLTDRRRIAKIIVNNSDKISIHTTKAKRAGAYLQSPTTQCVNLLTAYVGMGMCRDGAEEMAAGFEQIAAAQEKIDFGRLGIKVKKDELTAQKERVMAQIQVVQTGEDQTSLPALEEALQQVTYGLEVVLPVKEAELATGQKNRDIALKDLKDKKEKCDSLPALWASLGNYHINLAECGKQKAVVDTNANAAMALGKEMVMAVGPQNWYATDATKTKLVINKNKIEKLSVAFAAPGQEIQEYSIENGSITKETYGPRLRELKFTIEEKDENGFPNGNLIPVCLEKTAIDDVQKYTGHIKRIVNGKVVIEGKMSIEFKN